MPPEQGAAWQPPEPPGEGQDQRPPEGSAFPGALGPVGAPGGPGGFGPHAENPNGPAPYPGHPLGPGPYAENPGQAPYPGGQSGPGPYAENPSGPAPYPGGPGGPGPYAESPSGPAPYPGGPGGPGPYAENPSGPAPYPGGPGGPGPYAENPSGPAPYPGIPAGSGPYAGQPGGPPGWGGGQPWGVPPQPYGFGPQPAKKSKGPLIAVLAGGGALLVLLAVIVVVALSGPDDNPKTTSGKAANKAGQALGQAAGVTLTGTYDGGQSTFSVTKAGSVRGTYTAGGSQVTRLDVGGTTYLKTDRTFWAAQGGLSADRAAKADGKWTKAPDDLARLNLADLSPARLASALRGAMNDPLAVRTTVNGVKAIKMRTGPRTYYISKSEPRRLLRVEGFSGSQRYTFDVAALPAASITTVFTALRSDVQGLANAYDPDLTVLPVSKVQFGSCGEAGCTVRADIRATTVSDSSGAVHVTMKVAFSGGGGTVSTCTDAVSTSVNRQTSLSCRTSGGDWSSWYRSHNGRFTVHAKANFDATVNSSADVNGLLGKLAQEQRTG
ncbi:hypothetical protein [Actinoallomurus sp. NPDC050550]|uniref:hypothetical protein n=1 Tax=Actinoallomurus sp. NPDC050550 TaxID=3154937 RepID=UPI00340F40E5